MAEPAVININDHVQFKLTDEGERKVQIYLDTFVALGYRTIEESFPMNENGFREMPLWEFMQILGTGMYMGAQCLIKNNEIIWEDPAWGRKLNDLKTSLSESVSESKQEQP